MSSEDKSSLATDNRQHIAVTLDPTSEYL